MFKLAAARRVLTAPGRRAMSGTSIETGHTLNTTFRQYAIPVIDTTPGAAHHHHEEVELWKKITAVGSVVVSACFLNWMATDHHHMHTPPPYPCALTALTSFLFSWVFALSAAVSRRFFVRFLAVETAGTERQNGARGL